MKTDKERIAEIEFEVAKIELAMEKTIKILDNMKILIENQKQLNEKLFEALKELGKHVKNESCCHNYNL